MSDATGRTLSSSWAISRPRGLSGLRPSYCHSLQYTHRGGARGQDERLRKMKIHRWSEPQRLRRRLVDVWSHGVTQRLWRRALEGSSDSMPYTTAGW